MSLERGRCDYASVLLSTPSLDIVSRVERLSIDGQLVDIKIIKEWGYNIGEDVCIFDDGEDQQSLSDNEDVQSDPEVCKNVDTIVDNIVKELEKEKLDAREDGREEVAEVDVGPEALSNIGSHRLADEDVGGMNTQSIPQSLGVRFEHANVEANPSGGDLVQVIEGSKVVSQDLVDSHEEGDQGKKTLVPSAGKGFLQLVSGPPLVVKPVMTGLWSSEMLKDLHGGAGVIFSAKRKLFM